MNIEYMDVMNRGQWHRLLIKAKAGDKDAQLELGSSYQHGVKNCRGKIIIHPSPQLAIHWYTLAAQQGDEFAQVVLGNLLSDRELVEPDTKAAIYWMKQAIRQGSATAAYNLGVIYRDLGKPGRAYRWLSSSFQNGRRYEFSSSAGILLSFRRRHETKYKSRLRMLSKNNR